MAYVRSIMRHQSPAKRSDPRETTEGYQPPRSAEEHEWWALAIKSSVALFIAALACRMTGLAGVTTSVIAAAFLVAAPPVATLRTTIYRIGAMVAGTAMGAVGALWGLSNDGLVPAVFFLFFGAAVGIFASRKAALTYAAAIGAVVAATGASGRRPVGAIVVDTGAQLLIGTAAAVLTVWAFEKARAELSGRHR